MGLRLAYWEIVFPNFELKFSLSYQSPLSPIDEELFYVFHRHFVEIQSDREQGRRKEREGEWEREKWQPLLHVGTLSRSSIRVTGPQIISYHPLVSKFINRKLSWVLGVAEVQVCILVLNGGLNNWGYNIHSTCFIFRVEIISQYFYWIVSMGVVSMGTKSLCVPSK